MFQVIGFKNILNIFLYKTSESANKTKDESYAIDVYM